MKTMIPLALVGALFLTACAGPAPVVPTTPALAPAATLTSELILAGRVEFPEEPGYQVLAAPADVGVRASVSLIEPGGAVRAGGVTDAMGGFVLYQSTERFVPTTGGIYTLEIAKRLGGKQSLLALRTLLRWNGTAWESISGATILVNSVTTVIAQLEADTDDGELAPGDVMGVAPGGVVKAGFGPEGAFDAALVAGEVASLRARLAANMDPVSEPAGWDYRGNYVVSNRGDLKDLKIIKRIKGDLIIAWTEDEFGKNELSAPLLRLVEGDVIISDRPMKPRKLSVAYETLASKEPEALIDGITTLEGLGSLEAIGGMLRIEATRQLKTLKGLERLKQVQAVEIVGNAALRNLDSLGGLESAERVVIRDNDRLTSAAGLSRVERLDELRVRGNAVLTALPGGGRLRQVGGELAVINNDHLESLAGFEGLERVRYVVFEDNERLSEDCVHLLIEQLDEIVDASVYDNDGESTDCAPIEGDAHDEVDAVE